MKVKKFIAPTMPEVMQKVRKELGNDAVILHSKGVYTGGFLGLFKKRNIEVVAAIDPEPTPPPKPKQETTSFKQVMSFADEKQPDKQQQVVLEELRSLRKWMESSVADNTERIYPAGYQSVYDELVENEIDDEIAHSIIEKLTQNNNSEQATYQEVKEQAYQYIEQELNRFDCGKISYQKKFVHLVGPTGVGKTTTIAKIAANSMLKDGKKVALITTDTYRIAAIDQLKTYSKILDIPLEIAYTMEDYQKARLKFQSYDIVFVDTAGRNFRDPKYIADLGKIVDLEHDIETYLVLSLTTKSRDLADIYQQFDAVPLKKLIFTKKDETSSFGAIINLALQYKIGVAYLTYGQDVPDDIEEASGKKIAQLVMGELNNE